MSEGMSAERLAEIREMNKIEHVNAEAAKVLLPLQIRELLDEVERLHSRAKLHASVKSLAKSLIRSYKEERDELRARLDEIGETREEWGLRLSTHHNDDAKSYGHGDIGRWEARAAQQYWHVLVHRHSGEWREVPDA